KPRHRLQSRLGHRLPQVGTENRPEHAGETDDETGLERDIRLSIMRYRAGDGHEDHRREGGANRLVDRQAEAEREHREHGTGATGSDETKEDADAEGDQRDRED